MKWQHIPITINGLFQFVVYAEYPRYYYAISTNLDKGVGILSAQFFLDVNLFFRSMKYALHS